MQRYGASAWRGKVKARDLLVARVVGEDHEVVAVGGGGEVAPDDLGYQEVVGFGEAQLLAQRGADPLLEGGVVLTVFRSKAPLVAKERGQVQELGDLVERHALCDPAAEEGGREEGIVDLDLGTAAWQFGRRCRPLFAKATLHVLGRDLSTEGRVVGAAPANVTELVEDAQPFEGVLAVEETAADRSREGRARRRFA